MFVNLLLKQDKNSTKKISEETEFLGNYASHLYFSEFLINIILNPKKKYIIQLINNIPKLKINNKILYTKNRNATMLWFIPFLKITNNNSKNKTIKSAKYTQTNCPITWKIKCISFVDTLALSCVRRVCSRI